jgi:hypothetical protein
MEEHMPDSRLLPMVRRNCLPSTLTAGGAGMKTTKTQRRRYVAMLAEKLPGYDYTWSEEWQLQWWKIFNDILSMWEAAQPLYSRRHDIPRVQRRGVETTMTDISILPPDLTSLHELFSR